MEKKICTHCKTWYDANCIAI